VVLPARRRGYWPTRSSGSWRAAQKTLQNRRLEICAALPDAQVLIEELKNLRGTVSEAGHDRYEARERDNKDLLLDLSMAVWFREYRYKPGGSAG
jgi:hypothetical protein